MPAMTDLIDAYALRLRAAGRSPYTISTRCRVLRRADKILPRGLDKACGDEIAAYLAGRRPGWTQSTYYSAFNGFYAAMVRTGKLDYNPMTAVDRPQAGDSLPNPVSDAELAHAIAHSPDDPWLMSIVLGAYAGLRCGESAGLDRDDVTQQRLHVVRGKGGRGRYVPTHPLVWQLVQDRPCGRVVRAVDGGPISAERLTATQAAHWKRIGLPPEVHLHRFRHWFGTTLCDQGVGIEVVCELMGHRSIATTQGYVRVSQAKRDAAIVRLPDRTPEPYGSRLGRATEAA